ncbi:MAG: Holliday junction resolvase RuvX [Alicyclobacillus macrosporangiidus]|uniref:Holliday junction resolvase RuvX n=1 Tax=Alicyclobacillus macrosporangiidus TaxID=392015 RepID=UPI0026EF2EFE|nr:Holliday junction resolvase RuvX [Alicyclobacillus macrosporangiidus]MCL6598243.1 Holliday junction resolvase RuvX [Alicyclobacillus macrosporangiidus]
MRTLGVDYGSARIGLAISDPTGLLAQSLTVLARESDDQAARAIREMAREHGVEEIVVGYPRHMNGSAGGRAAQCEAFAERLREETGLPVVLYDERLTTVAAERMLIAADVSRRRRKQVIDSVAATVLLQGYLDWKRSHTQKRGGTD